MRRDWPEAAGAKSAREMTSDEAERLRSLGYVHGDAAPAPGPLPDVKAMVAASGHLGRALRLQRENRLDEALQAAGEAAKECPGYLDAAALVAQLCQQMGRMDEAVRVLKAQLEINPTAAAALQLAQTCLAQGQAEEMESALTIAARLEPDNGFVHVLRGDRHSLQGRTSEAVREYEEAVRMDPYRTGPIVRPVLEKLKARLGSAAGL
jgi:tetratricopeptide (TPR) repeat protein